MQAIVEIRSVAKVFHTVDAVCPLVSLVFVYFLAAFPVVEFISSVAALANQVDGSGHLHIFVVDAPFGAKRSELHIILEVFEVLPLLAQVDALVAFYIITHIGYGAHHRVGHDSVAQIFLYHAVQVSAFLTLERGVARPFVAQYCRFALVVERLAHTPIFGVKFLEEMLHHIAHRRHLAHTAHGVGV